MTFVMRSRSVLAFRRTSVSKTGFSSSATLNSCRTCDARFRSGIAADAAQGCPVFVSRPGPAAPQPSGRAWSTSEVDPWGLLRGRPATHGCNTHLSKDASTVRWFFSLLPMVSSSSSASNKYDGTVVAGFVPEEDFSCL